ncbi:MAG TPA: 2-oxoglutarate dehydrogenase, E2 component, dihydrolipoamide succinyltransferase [Bryobacteraceae bacterium]|jgi:2-oxoglutarate dehydrogenase E2 component (dihydrolipoamide succinyltransferase)|nr:2-oxoglutarate dehydrogenase, E2 component, dihydrolipoamide succinyltransferase [Bryobacteraceae bacterium]
MIDVVMPQMGESIVEGTLTKWLKKAGEHVERDEPLFEISTDKVDTEIPSPAAGVLSQVLVEEGKTVAIGTTVGKIEESGAASAQAPAAAEAPASTPPPAPAPAAKAAAPAPAQPAPSQPAPAASAASEPAGPLSPLVRKMAREYNIDLKQVKGTGAGGRITKQDLEAFMSAQGARTIQSAAQPASAPASPAPAAPAAPESAPPVARGEQPRTRLEPMSIMRQRIAEHMVMSKRTSAHVTTVHRVDMTKVAKMRERNKEEFKSRYGFSLTFLPFVTRATVLALRAYPLLNASIEGTNVLYHNDVNIGIAVALENGLIVPVIRNADEKNIIGLQRSIADLAARARSRQLKPDEAQGGTFSITNFGSFGSVFATPVINQPQVAILGCGAVEKEPVVVNDAIAIRSMAYLALTFDHRLIDGALADQFTGKVKDILQNWSEEVL